MRLLSIKVKVFMPTSYGAKWQKALRFLGIS